MRTENDFTLYDFMTLLNYLANDIQELELEIIRLRFHLIQHLPAHDGMLLKSELFSNLGGRYNWHKIYQEYVALYCNGIDPLDNEYYSKQLHEMSKQGYVNE